MAGMGFELRKIFARKSRTEGALKVLHASLTTLGAYLVFVILLFVSDETLNILQASDAQKDIFFHTFTGVALIGILISSVVNSVLFRYVSDKIMAEEESRAGASLLGSMLFSSVGAAFGIGILCFVQWRNGAENWLVFALCYIFGILWTILHNLMVYTTVLKKYGSVMISCMAGILVFCGSIYGCCNIGELNVVEDLFAALIMSLFVVDLCLACVCRRALGAPDESHFAFLGYFKKYAFLWGSGVLFFSGLFVLIYLLWLYAGFGVNKILFCNLPGLFLFEYLLRRQLYAKYNMYIAAIEEGSFEIIEREKTTLQKALKLQLTFVCVMQIVFSVFFTEFSTIWLKSDAITVQSGEGLLLAAGMALVFCMYYIITVFCYFSGYKESFLITTIFAVVAMAVAFYCYVFVNTCYALPLFVGGGIGCGVAFLMLRSCLKDMNAYMLCK